VEVAIIEHQVTIAINKKQVATQIYGFQSHVFGKVVILENQATKLIKEFCCDYSKVFNVFFFFLWRINHC
jgi:hypothetical protein